MFDSILEETSSPTHSLVSFGLVWFWI